MRYLGSRSEATTRTADSVFGPGGCVSLTKSETGTCVIRTNCDAASISQVTFAFVCTNGAGDALRRALHSYGQGGFDPMETFDSKVKCDSCVTVEHAFSAVQERRAISQLSLASGSLRGAGQGAAAAAGPSGPAWKPSVVAAEASVAMYGPGACVSAFKSTNGTCLIQTKCVEEDISGYDVGLTCVDRTGDYTQYSFGKSVFFAEETFDTRLPCAACLGTGNRPSFQRSAVLPKALLEEVNMLNIQVKHLRDQVGDGDGSAATVSTAGSQQAAASAGGAAAAGSQQTAKAAAQQQQQGQSESNSLYKKSSRKVMPALDHLPPKGQGPSVAVAVASADAIANAMAASKSAPSAPLAPSAKQQPVVPAVSLPVKSLPKAAASLAATAPAEARAPERAAGAGSEAPTRSSLAAGAAEAVSPPPSSAGPPSVKDLLRELAFKEAL